MRGPRFSGLWNSRLKKSQKNPTACGVCRTRSWECEEGYAMAATGSSAVTVTSLAISCASLTVGNSCPTCMAV